MSALLTLLAQSDFLDPNAGPDPTGGFRIDPTAFVVTFIAGFVIGVFGHIVKSKTIVAAGIALIFLATIAAPLFLAATK